MNYLKLLVESFEESHLLPCPCTSRTEFLSRYIFDFTTYDDEMDELLGQKAVEVFQAISDRKTFEYIADGEQYRWFIIMCNMPFFSNRIDWGTSIRGAWWKTTQPPVISFGLFSNRKQITSLAFASGEWAVFTDAVIQMSAPDRAANRM